MARFRAIQAPFGLVSACFSRFLEATRLDELKPLELVMAVTALARKKLQSIHLPQLQLRLEDMPSIQIHII